MKILICPECNNGIVEGTGNQCQDCWYKLKTVKVKRIILALINH